MYSDKKSVLLLAASLKAYGIDQIVLSPGSRNVPLLHTFSQEPFFHCHRVVDERSAAFFALGVIQKLRRPVAICCTSGTALLNYGPAIAEAFYQQLPLVVISADRSAAWVGQMDGQTIPQPALFNTLVKKSVQLPEVSSPQDEWYCQRMIHEALLGCQHNQPGPVHINVPLSEPLFNFSVEQLPQIAPIKRVTQASELISEINLSTKRMIVVGQLPQNHAINDLLVKLAQQFNFVIVAEHLANLDSPEVIGNVDLLLASFNEQQQAELAPDLLISCGGHLVSKRLKQFLRAHRPQVHYTIREDGELVDLFQFVSVIVQQEAAVFFGQLLSPSLRAGRSDYRRIWQNLSQKISFNYQDYPFSDLVAMGAFIAALPAQATLFLSNSSCVRNAQLYALKPTTSVLCNRGTNGIDGTLSTLMGFAALHDQITFLALGDLSFFYDLNALCSGQLRNNIRIILFNNGGGGIFHLLPGLDKSPALDPYVAAQHNTQAERWALAAGLHYGSADNLISLQQQLIQFVDPRVERPMLLEVFTSMSQSGAAFKQLISTLKNRDYE